ncbi:Hypothetical Protein FCC1311_002222 [Hondaea fermentalgiana]|uniref:Uncharacterized protein n=1 Tax=Hondaea fermentalgiana TaxID=2315210 RepID=A0A2R5G8K0_9STRA|nr:Hypothetical Protein FCC1311_002222 [Hondaea fermentalgiana]|eukprot:GBG24004.1 Hypothetical Protein FCC1311_002222 [Hondaea fermentalgiana]
MTAKEANWFLDALESYHRDQLTPAERNDLENWALRDKAKHRHAVLFEDDLNFLIRGNQRLLFDATAFSQAFSRSSTCNGDRRVFMLREATKMVLQAYRTSRENAPPKSCIWSALMTRLYRFLVKSNVQNVEIVERVDGVKHKESTLLLQGYHISRSNFTKLARQIWTRMEAAESFGAEVEVDVDADLDAEVEADQDTDGNTPGHDSHASSHSAQAQNVPVPSALSTQARFGSSGASSMGSAMSSMSSSSSSAVSAAVGTAVGTASLDLMKEDKQGHFNSTMAHQHSHQPHDLDFRQQVPATHDEDSDGNSEIERDEADDSKIPTYTSKTEMLAKVHYAARSLKPRRSDTDNDDQIETGTAAVNKPRLWKKVEAIAYHHHHECQTSTPGNAKDPDSRKLTIVATCKKSSEARIYSLYTGTASSKVFRQKTKLRKVACLALSTSGRYAAAALHDHRAVHIFDLNDLDHPLYARVPYPETLAKTETLDPAPVHLAISDNARCVLLSTPSNQIWMYHPPSPQESEPAVPLMSRKRARPAWHLRDPTLLIASAQTTQAIVVSLKEALRLSAQEAISLRVCDLCWTFDATFIALTLSDGSLCVFTGGGTPIALAATPHGPRFATRLFFRSLEPFEASGKIDPHFALARHASLPEITWCDGNRNLVHLMLPGHRLAQRVRTSLRFGHSFISVARALIERLPGEAHRSEDQDALSFFQQCQKSGLDNAANNLSPTVRGLAASKHSSDVERALQAWALCTFAGPLVWTPAERALASTVARCTAHAVRRALADQPREALAAASHAISLAQAHAQGARHAVMLTEHMVRSLVRDEHFHLALHLLRFAEASLRHAAAEATASDGTIFDRQWTDLGNAAKDAASTEHEALARAVLAYVQQRKVAWDAQRIESRHSRRANVEIGAEELRGNRLAHAHVPSGDDYFLAGQYEDAEAAYARDPDGSYPLMCLLLRRMHLKEAIMAARTWWAHAESRAAHQGALRLLGTVMAAEFLNDPNLAAVPSPCAHLTRRSVRWLDLGLLARQSKRVTDWNPALAGMFLATADGVDIAHRVLASTRDPRHALSALAHSAVRARFEASQRADIFQRQLVAQLVVRDLQSCARIVLHVQTSKESDAVCMALLWILLVDLDMAVFEDKVDRFAFSAQRVNVNQSRRVHPAIFIGKLALLLAWTSGCKMTWRNVLCGDDVPISPFVAAWRPLLQSLALQFWRITTSQKTNPQLSDFLRSHGRTQYLPGEEMVKCAETGDQRFVEIMDVLLGGPTSLENEKSHHKSPSASKLQVDVPAEYEDMCKALERVHSRQRDAEVRQETRLHDALGGFAARLEDIAGALAARPTTEELQALTQTFSISNMGLGQGKPGGGEDSDEEVHEVGNDEQSRSDDEQSIQSEDEPTAASGIAARRFLLRVRHAPLATSTLREPFAASSHAASDDYGNVKDAPTSNQACKKSHHGNANESGACKEHTVNIST